MVSLGGDDWVDQSIEESKTSVVVCSSHYDFGWSRQDRLSIVLLYQLHLAIYLYLLLLNYLQSIEKLWD